MSFREHFKPYQPDAETEKSRAFLPHWEQPGCTYFVTWRMADSIPMDKLRALQNERVEWLAQHPKPWDDSTWKEFGQRFEGRVQEWLDLGEGSRFLGNTEARQIVVDALHFFDGQRYHLGDYVVMPNHVHVLFSPLSGFGLKKLLHSWKSFTSKEILKRWPEAPNPFWLMESFDHIVRSEAQLKLFQDYIRENPAKAHLKPGTWTHWEPEECG
ncbi:MAG: transposase [Prosthecobacter sp.]